MSGRGLTACNHGEASLTSGPGYGFSGAMCHKCGAFARFEAAAAREALESRLVLLAALGHIRSLSLVPHGSPEAFYRSQVSDAIATAQRAIDMDRAARASDGGR